MACTTIGDQSVHFHFGVEQCYNGTWILSVIFLILIILAFSVIFVKLKYLDAASRQNNHNPLSKITSRYKPNYYYWEFIIFIRRILIALFSVSVHDITWKFIFVCIMVYFAILQKRHEPFIIHQANNLEYYLLLCFILIAVSQLISTINAVFLNMFISILIITPIILVSYYVYHLIKIKTIDIDEDKVQLDAAINMSQPDDNGNTQDGNTNMMTSAKGETILDDDIEMVNIEAVATLPQRATSYEQEDLSDDNLELSSDSDGENGDEGNKINNPVEAENIVKATSDDVP